MNFLALLFPYIEKKLHVSDTFIEQSSLQLDQQIPLEPFLQENLISKADSMPLFSLGGELIDYLQKLMHEGARATFLGKLGIDSAGSYYQSELSKSQRVFNLSIEEGETSQSIRLINPHGRAATGFYLGASSELDAFEVASTSFSSMDAFFLDANAFIWGYLPVHLAQHARVSGAKVCFILDATLNLSPYLVEIFNFIRDVVDYLIVSDQTAEKVFSALSDSQKSNLLNSPTFTVVTNSQGGAEIYEKGQIQTIDDAAKYLCHFFMKKAAKL